MIGIKKTNSPVSWAILLILAAILTILIYQLIPGQSFWQKRSGEWMEINTKQSLIHVGSNDSFAITQDGILAGRLVLNYLETTNFESAQKAINLYERLIPVENYGGEYSALQWFSQYFLATDKHKKAMLADPYVASFYEFFARNNFAPLKEYLQRKYKLATFPDSSSESGQNRLALLEDTMLFENPQRETWEKTSKILQGLEIKPGQTIADIGSGPGYYTFKFAKLVGDNGKVYAIDTVQDHLNYVNNVSKKYNIPNVTTVNNDPGTTIGVEENQVDIAWMCSLYHNIYGYSKEDQRSDFVESIRKSLKKDGTLVIVDNGLVKKTELPYHGPYIAKELIIGQLKYYGFRLIEQYNPIPQRYVLIFKKI